MSVRQFILYCTIVLGGSQCTKTLPPNDYPEISVPEFVPTGDEAYITGDSEYIFDQEALRTYSLILSGSALHEINSNPTAEKYVEGMLVFESDTISPVGIRYKGSVGGFVGCVSGNDWTNPSGFKTCSKLSMKIKINWEGREERFYGLKKLQFHSMNLDDSKMHDRLGYYLFREMGVPAPRAVHARLEINGDFAGLFSLVEQIDKRFIKENFDDDAGNLYKELWPLDMQENIPSNQEFFQALRTNEDDNPSFDIFKSFGQSMRSAQGDQASDILQNRMDMDETMSMIVVDRTIRHDDGPFHWYCSGNFCSPHNFYWYEEPTNQKVHLIPWDLDNAFENIIQNENPVTPIADAFGEISNDCQPFGYGSWNAKQRSAACDKIVAGWASFDDLYQYHKDRLLGDVMTKESIDAKLDQWKAQIRDAVIEENQVFDDVVEVEEWEEAMELLQEQLEFARNK